MEDEFRQHHVHHDYWFTESGKVASIKRNNLTGRECFRELKPNPSQRYIRVAICDSYQRYTTGLHRLVWETFNGTIPEGFEVNHKDGNKHNNHLSNLEICTSQENIKHAFETGLNTAPKGVNHPRSRFSDEDINHIRLRLLKQREYAGMYGCHVTTIQRIQYGKTY